MRIPLGGTKEKKIKHFTKFRKTLPHSRFAIESLAYIRGFDAGLEIARRSARLAVAEYVGHRKQYNHKAKPVDKEIYDQLNETLLKHSERGLRSLSLAGTSNFEVFKPDPKQTPQLVKLVPATPVTLQTKPAPDTAIRNLPQPDTAIHRGIAIPYQPSIGTIME